MPILWHHGTTAPRHPEHRVATGPGFDAQIADICRSHRAAFATRNTDDFGGLGLDLTEPWLIGA
jgi:predicted nucleic acid-binding protein